MKDLGTNPGSTGSHLIECDDGRAYVVKFAGGTKAAINEFVGQTLASKVGLPVPEVLLVDLDADFVGSSADLRYRSISPGLHVGSAYISHCVHLDDWRHLEGHGNTVLENLEVIPGTICHDNWIITEDRDRADNHLVQVAKGKPRYLMIDFTHGFTGPFWTADSLEQASYLRGLVPSIPFLTDMVTGLSSLQPILGRIEAISDSQLESTIRDIPEAWSLSADEAGCLLSFLQVRRGLLRSTLTDNRRSFRNWSD